MKDLLASYLWKGTFFVPDEFEKRFSGSMSYSPEKGLHFECISIGSDLPKQSDVLHGVLDTGEPCSIFLSFKPEYFGLSINNNLQTRPAKISARLFIIGGHILTDTKVEYYSFTLTNFEELFFPAGHKPLIKYSPTPIYSVNTKYGEIKIVNSGKFSPQFDIDTNIYSTDKKALQQLKDCYEEVQASNPKSFFMLKKDISYLCELNLTNADSIENAYSHIVDFAALIALLTYHPTYCNGLQIQYADKKLKLDVIPHVYINARTLDMIRSTPSHFDLPISNRTASLDDLIEKWSTSTRNSVIIASIQNETNFRSEHQVHGEIMLYATQMENIAYADKQTSKKYEYTLNKYASKCIVESLETILSVVGAKQLGIKIGDLRNEIAHVGKPKQLLLQMDQRQLMRIAGYMHLIVISYILEQLDVSKQLIENYQSAFSPNA